MPNNITLTVPEGTDINGTTLKVNGKTYRLTEDGREKKGEWWTPDGLYYYLSNHDTIEACHWLHTTPWDISRHKARNCFRSQEDAELHAKFIKATVEAMAERFEVREDVWYINHSYKSSGTYPIEQLDIDSGELFFRTEAQAEAYSKLRREYARVIRSYRI